MYIICGTCLNLHPSSLNIKTSPFKTTPASGPMADGRFTLKFNQVKGIGNDFTHVLELSKVIVQSLASPFTDGRRKSSTWSSSGGGSPLKATFITSPRVLTPTNVLPLLSNLIAAISGGEQGRSLNASISIGSFFGSDATPPSLFASRGTRQTFPALSSRAMMFPCGETEAPCRALCLPQCT